SVLRTPHSALAVVLALGLAVLAWLNLDFYFRQYQVLRPEFEIGALEARWFAALGPDYIARMVGRTWQAYNTEAMPYFVSGQDGGTLFNPATELPLPLTAGKGLGFAFADDDEQYAPAVNAFYPGGTGGELFAHQGTHLFYT